MMKPLLNILIVALLLSGCALDKRVARSNKKYFAKAPYDVIIVPGYPYYEKDAPYPLLEARMNFTKELYEKGLAKNIIFSGGAVHTSYTEAKVMSIIADTMGIPADHIFLEEKAPHSFQNVTYSAKMARKLGFKKIAVATDPFQFAYMTLFLPAGRVGILTFSPDSLQNKKYFQPLPKFETKDAYIKDFVPVEQR
jgi:uncharacterized SAM-binding protein YcdF (DUF218 family)